MARKKIIEDNVLLELIGNYFVYVCQGKRQNFKKPQIAEYVAEHGYPEFNAVLLRRNEAACEYIETLRATSEEEHLATVVCYKTLDVDKFIDNNKSIESLKKALIDLDCYYRKIADSAAEIHRISKPLLDENAKLKSSLAEEKNNADIANKEIAQLSEAMKSLKRENNVLRQYIKNYTVPDIANKILAADKVIKPVKNTVSDEAVKKNIINASDEVKPTTLQMPKSNIIEGAFKRLEE